jgi:hypothetical protein
MRYREKINQLDESVYYNTLVHADPQLDSSSPADYTSMQAYSAMLDVVTENWKTRMAKGEIINNPMLSLTSVQNNTPFMYTFRLTDPDDSTNYGTYTHGIELPADYQATSLDWDYWYDHILDVFESERDVALSKAWANVDISSIQALASLGELPETVHWMTSLVKRMISIMRAFTQKKLLLNVQKFVQSGRSVINELSELWLEFRYAVRPLIFDMQQAVEAWNAVLQKSDRFTARGFNRADGVTTSSTETVILNEAMSAIISRTQQTSADYRAGVLYTIDDNVNELMSVWGIDQPIETVWELIPFSFMIDWFFSVGHVISSWTINPGLNPLASFITEEHTTTIKSEITGCFQTKDITSSGNLVTNVGAVSAGCNLTKVITKRRLPSPQRSIMPTFNLNLDTAKLIDLAAIGRDLFRTLGRS